MNYPNAVIHYPDNPSGLPTGTETLVLTMNTPQPDVYLMPGTWEIVQFGGPIVWVSVWRSSDNHTIDTVYEVYPVQSIRSMRVSR